MLWKQKLPRWSLEIETKTWQRLYFSVSFTSSFISKRYQQLLNVSIKGSRAQISDRSFVLPNKTDKEQIDFKKTDRYKTHPKFCWHLNVFNFPQNQSINIKEHSTPTKIADIKFNVIGA